MLNTDIRNSKLEEFDAVTLRHYAGKLGVKGASRGRKADLLVALKAIQAEQIAERARQDAEAAPKKGICEDCGRKVGKSGHPTLCTPCFDFAGWENTHNDDAHGAPEREAAESEADCPVCHPELDPRTAVKPGRSRLGMVIIAKGTEIHKSETFRKAAETAGWTVTVQSETYELPEDAEGEGTRYYATATRTTQLGPDDSISLAWDGRAYDYPSSSAVLNGKDRKIRNLKEALRVL